jgi:hypothetical protein
MQGVRRAVCRHDRLLSSLSVGCADQLPTACRSVALTNGNWSCTVTARDSQAEGAQRATASVHSERATDAVHNRDHRRMPLALPGHQTCHDSSSARLTSGTVSGMYSPPSLPRMVHRQPFISPRTHMPTSTRAQVLARA